MTETATAQTVTLTFLHLSDIHFRGRYQEGSAFDLDHHIRNELERDLHGLVDENGPLTAVLVGGDVAFAGKEGR